MLRVLHVVPSFFPAVRYGGPIESVLRLCQALRARGIHIEVLTTDADGPSDLAITSGALVEVEGVPVRYFRRRPRTSFTVSMELAAHLHRASADFDLLHVTSAFSFPSAAAGLVARRRRVPYVVSPRGSLRTWAFAHRGWKKRPYFQLIERQNLRGAAALHVTSDAERDELLPIVSAQRVVVVPNGVDLPETQPSVARVPGRIVFLGRLHPVKGFDVLVPALSRMAITRPDIETVVAGPDDVGEWAAIEQRIARSRPRPRIRYLGPVRGAQKDDLLASAELLVLPSHSENFGQVVVEALACGTPVVTSRNCPWSELEEVGAGAWVENTPAEIADAMLSILADPTRARAMGERGRQLARRYTWSSAAARMEKCYEQALVGRVARSAA